jgi:hypothetical protein
MRSCSLHIRNGCQRQRQEEEQHMRKEAQESHMAKQYAQNMLLWGAMVQAHYEQLQKFMEVRHPFVFILVSIKYMSH